MADSGLDVAAAFPTNIQTYATLIASLVLGVITVYGYYKKVSSDIPANTPIYSEANLKEILAWLNKIFEQVTLTSSNTKLIGEVLLQNQRQDEIDRAYNRGRDESLARQTAKVASNLSAKD